MAVADITYKFRPPSYVYIYIYICIYISDLDPRSKIDHLTTLEKAEITPRKNSVTRIKPLPLTNDHGRYITVINLYTFRF